MGKFYHLYFILFIQADGVYSSSNRMEVCVKSEKKITGMVNLILRTYD